MDPRKLKVLQDIPYRIQPTCGLCQHGWFPKDDWGTCEIHEYEHEKHTGARRKLSIYKAGSCPKFEAKTNLTFLGAFKQFGP